MTLFVDSSVWYAAADAGDRSHLRATEVLAAEERLVTTDHVLVESWLLLHHRLGGAVAEKFWGALRAGVARIEVVVLADLEAAFAIGEAFPDQDFAITDRTSFAVMERLGLRRVASFDRDFSIVRVGPARREAFDVVR